MSPPPPLPNLWVEIPVPNVMILGVRAFGRLLGHEGSTLMSGISALIKETSDRALVLFLPHEDLTRGQ